MMLQDVPSVVNSQPLRDAPDVAVNGIVAGDHANNYVLCTYVCLSVHLCLSTYP